MKTKIDMKQFMKDCMLTNNDKKQMRSLDKKTIKSDPNYKNNKRVNLEYYNEDELEDTGMDNYSDSDNVEN
ncbi:hypothetical protein HOE22_05670 [Candidatus Woesearchaeota archaeon]|jgi:ribosomal protein L35|nr:hypothetical protein [Candidatus Woesearchaeota archaeon]MBT7558787.1 hypothetical protein [Candidatus Woesearchaeota archaeon]